MTIPTRPPTWSSRRRRGGPGRGRRGGIKPYLRAGGDRLAFIAASPTTAPVVVTLRLPDRHVEALADTEPGLHPGDVSVPERLQVPARDGGTVHAVCYPPTNHVVTGPPGQCPPLIVQPHPGPTSDAQVRLELRTQFLTTALRGLATTDRFAAGVSWFGITDLAAFRAGYPAFNVITATVSSARGPTLRQRSLPVTELCSPTRGHRLRRADNITHALEAELIFYRAVLRGSTL